MFSYHVASVSYREVVHNILLSIRSCVCVCRWACFCLSIQDIENSVSAMLRGQVVGY